MAKPGFVPNKLKPWVDARKKYRLTHAQVQMARELGMNPKKLGGLDNSQQEKWKLPLPQFIEERYRRQFGKSMPDDVRSLEDRVQQKRERRKAAKEKELEQSASESEDRPSTD